MLAGLIIYLVFVFGLVALMIAARWKIYTKAGKPGWACLIPIYSFIVFCEIAGKPWWTIFMLLIPIYGIVVAIQVIHGVSKSFGKDGGFTAGLIFLPIIFYPILAFGKATYVGPGGQPAAQA
jgi:hypothetical protein